VVCCLVNSSELLSDWRTHGLGPIAPSWFSFELDEMADMNWITAFHHFKINSFSLERKFKPELPILSDQMLNFAFIK